MDVRERRVPDGVLAPRHVEQVGVDDEQHERLGHVGVVALEHARHLVLPGGVQEADLGERGAARRGRVAAGGLGLLPVGGGGDVVDPHGYQCTPLSRRASIICSLSDPPLLDSPFAAEESGNTW